MNQIEQKFDYTQLDSSIAFFLKQKENNMREIVGKAYTELGRELKEANEKLANNRNGVFQSWIESLGFRKDKAYDLIRRYEFIIGISDDKKQLLEDLPVSLTYEISRPSSDSTPAKIQAKEAVMNGDIRTLKEYKSLVARLEEQERKTKEFEERASKAESEKHHYQKLWQQEKSKPPQVVVKTEKVLPDDYEENKKIVADLQRLNGENVQLARRNQELIQQLADNKSSASSLRKLKEYCVESIRTISASNNALLFELNVLRGNPDAHKIADEYGQKLSEELERFFKELKEVIDLRQIS